MPDDGKTNTGKEVDQYALADQLLAGINSPTQLETKLSKNERNSDEGAKNKTVDEISTDETTKQSTVNKSSENSIGKERVETSKELQLLSSDTDRVDQFTYSITEKEMRKIRDLERTSHWEADVFWYKIKQNHLECLSFNQKKGKFEEFSESISKEKSPLKIKNQEIFQVNSIKTTDGDTMKALEKGSLLDVDSSIISAKICKKVSEQSKSIPSDRNFKKITKFKERFRFPRQGDKKGRVDQASSTMNRVDQMEGDVSHRGSKNHEKKSLLESRETKNARDNFKNYRTKKSSTEESSGSIGSSNAIQSVGKNEEINNAKI